MLHSTLINYIQEKLRQYALANKFRDICIEPDIIKIADNSACGYSIKETGFTLLYFIPPGMHSYTKFNLSDPNCFNIIDKFIKDCARPKN